MKYSVGQNCGACIVWDQSRASKLQNTASFFLVCLTQEGKNSHVEQILPFGLGVNEMK